MKGFHAEGGKNVFRDTSHGFLRGDSSQTVLGTYFISQGTPDIWRKLPKLNVGPETNSPQLVNIAFKVFNNK